jgi:hypothetical protein
MSMSLITIIRAKATENVSFGTGNPANHHNTTRKTAIGSTATRSALDMWCAAGIYP